MNRKRAEPIEAAGAAKPNPHKPMSNVTPNSIASGMRKPTDDMIPPTEDMIVCPDPVISPFRQKVTGTMR